MPFYDTVVIGAGLAGLVAALRSQEQGQRTLLLAQGMGSLSWSHGCIDVLPVPAPLTALAELPATHPYQQAGAAALHAACGWLKTTMRVQNAPLAGSPAQSVLLPTAIGSWNAVALLPLTMMAATASNLKGATVLVVGLYELRDFYPALIAERLAARGIDARSVTIALPPTGRHHDWSALQVARLLEDAALRAALARTIREQRMNATVVLLPAVLGVDNPTTVLHDLQTRIGALIGEIPTLPASIPGLRLERALCNALVAAGGRIQLNAAVQRGDWQGQRLEAVWTSAAARTQRHQANRFILATGGIGGGGLRADYPAPLHDTALGLPVAQPATRAAWFAPALHDIQPIYQAGITADTSLRACDAQGQPFENLYVVGSALAGYDSLRAHSAAGIALVTGWIAGGA